jgi:hypothetical protein
MKYSQKLILLSLTMIMATQTLYANDTEHKELAVNNTGVDHFSVDSGSETLDDKGYSGISEYRKNKRPIRGHSTLSARSTAMPQSC